MRSAALVALSVLIAGPAVAQDKASIEKLNAAFVAAFDRRDFASLGQMYTEDAYLLPPGSPIIKRRDNVQAFWAKAADAVGDLKLTTLDVQALGPDAAREVGTFSLTMKKAQPEQVTGKFVVIWQRSGAEWKLATDIWNSDQ